MLKLKQTTPVTETIKTEDAATVVSPPAARDAAGDGQAAIPAGVDENGRQLGLEDPNDPAMQDDPAILTNGTAPMPKEDGPVASSLIDSTGLPYVDPTKYGGSMLDIVGNGFGEPLNVIISALSSPEILTKKGFQTYCRSLDFDLECFGLHSGGYQKAFLDPRGAVDQNFIYRQVYTPLDHIFGTCIESIVGGNHIRAWQQQGTGAWFLAASKEEKASLHHMIVPDGYNLGRNLFVEQSQSKKDTQTSFFFNKYRTKVEWILNLQTAGTNGVNHNIATDGRVALLTITKLGSSTNSQQKAAAKFAQEQKRASTIVGVGDIPQTVVSSNLPRLTASTIAEELREHPIEGTERETAKLEGAERTVASSRRRAAIKQKPKWYQRLKLVI